MASVSDEAACHAPLSDEAACHAPLSDEAACKALIGEFMERVGLQRYLSDDFPLIDDEYTERRVMTLEGTKGNVRLAYHGYYSIVFGHNGVSIGCGLDDIDRCREVAEEFGLKITHHVKRATDATSDTN